MHPYRMKQNAHPLAVIRRAKGLNQTHLAVQAGVGMATVQRAERGMSMSDETWDALANALGVPVDSIRGHAPRNTAQRGTKTDKPETAIAV